jgi:hypothetical protein
MRFVYLQLSVGSCLHLSVGSCLHTPIRWILPAYTYPLDSVCQDYVGGYAVGSEGFIPAAEYAYPVGSPARTWRYAFEKQWLWWVLLRVLLLLPTTRQHYALTLCTPQVSAVGGAVVRSVHTRHFLRSGLLSALPFSRPLPAECWCDDGASVSPCLYHVAQVRKLRVQYLGESARASTPVHSENFIPVHSENFIPVHSESFHT